CSFTRHCTCGFLIEFGRRDQRSSSSLVHGDVATRALHSFPTRRLFRSDAVAAGPLHRLDRVDRQFADELVRRAVPPQPFEEERHVADSQFEGGRGVGRAGFRTSRHGDSCDCVRCFFGLLFYTRTPRGCASGRPRAAAKCKALAGLTSPGAVSTVCSGSETTVALDASDSQYRLIV